MTRRTKTICSFLSRTSYLGSQELIINDLTGAHSRQNSKIIARRRTSASHYPSTRSTSTAARMVYGYEMHHRCSGTKDTSSGQERVNTCIEDDEDGGKEFSLSWTMIENHQGEGGRTKFCCILLAARQDHSP